MQSALPGEDSREPLSSRRSPHLFQFPSACDIAGIFPLITAPAFSRFHRLHSRLNARLPPPALNFFSASAGCLPAVRYVQSARSAATASHRLSKQPLLEVPKKKKNDEHTRQCRFVQLLQRYCQKKSPAFLERGRGAVLTYRNWRLQARNGRSHRVCGETIHIPS